jgi:hypothetical protein
MLQPSQFVCFLSCSGFFLLKSCSLVKLCYPCLVAVLQLWLAFHVVITCYLLYMLFLYVGRAQASVVDAC